MKMSTVECCCVRLAHEHIFVGTFILWLERMYDNKCAVICVVICAPVLVPAAEDYREGPHTLELQRRHVVPQV